MTGIIRRPGDSLFWGFVDYNEKIHVKRLTTDRAIRNAQDSGTTLAIIDPFYAADIKEALEMILEKWREDRIHFKKDAN